MSFLSKFKKELGELNISERLQAHQQANQQTTHTGVANTHGYSAQPPSYGYNHQPQANSPYHYQPIQEPHYQAQHCYGAAPQQPQVPPSATGSAVAYSEYQHNPHQQGLSSGPVGNPFVAPPPASSADFNRVSYVSGAPCPTPQWVPHTSEPYQQWDHVETNGGSGCKAPANPHPPPSMPNYAGHVSKQGHYAHFGYDQQVQGYAPAMPPGPPLVPGDVNKKSSPKTMLVAAGGLVAGGVAGYFIHDALDKRKAKKRHGRKPADFDDFHAYPSMEIEFDCNSCDQQISGPYAHCSRCDGGEYDACRDCLSQGITCDGRGKHRLVKVFPKYYCNGCDQLIAGDFYHCAICNDGDWDMCERCMDGGQTCKADGDHQLAKLYIPTPGFGGPDSSSDSE